MDNDILRQAAMLGAEGSPVHIEGVPLHRIELRKLRHAAVLAGEGNFTRAAEKLHITPSALSQSIANLEDGLGLVLFDRDKSGVVLSRVGRRFMGRIDKLLFDARGLARDLSLAGGAVSGDTVFGIRPTAARIVLSDLVRDVAREAPKLRLKIAITINEVLLEYLLHEGFEFVICDTPVHTLDDRLSSRRLASMPMEFYVRHNHPLAERDSFLLQDLRRFSIASPNLTDENYTSVRTSLGLAPTEDYPGGIWCDDFTFLMEAVVGGDAVLVAPAVAVADEVKAGKIRKITPSDATYQSECELYLVTLANRSVSPATRMIVDKIESYIAAKLLAPAAAGESTVKT
jgi:DNA-binding transcriptional LysR family regulator